MKKIVFACLASIACLAASAFTSCGSKHSTDESSQDETESSVLDNNIDDNDASPEEEAAPQENTDSINRQHLSEMANKFYQLLSKNKSVTPLLTSDFIQATKRGEATGLQFGTTTQCLAEACAGYSDSQYVKITWTVGEVTLDSEDSASVESTLKSIFANPEGTNDTFTFHDVIKMVKDGDDWKITDIVRDGKSLKKQWKKFYCGDGIAA